MTLAQLIAQFRSDVDDAVATYLFSDADIIIWLNEAEEEAALRARLIFDATTTAVCSITVTAGTNTYALSELVFVIERASFLATGETEPVKLYLRDRFSLDRTRPDWRTVEMEPEELIVDDKKVQLACLPASGGVLSLQVYRAPLTAMDDNSDTPEIGRAHHRHLVEWAKFRAFSRPDTEVFDAKRAETAEKAFTRQFGERPDADRRRATYVDQPHHTKAWV